MLSHSWPRESMKFRRSELNGWHFAGSILKCIFLDWKPLLFQWNGSDWQKMNIGWGDGLASYIWQVISWTKNALVVRYLMASLSLNELKTVFPHTMNFQCLHLYSEILSLSNLLGCLSYINQCFPINNAISSNILYIILMALYMQEDPQMALLSFTVAMCLGIWLTHFTVFTGFELTSVQWNCTGRIAKELESTLVQDMAWCCQAASHNLNHCRPRFVSSYALP